MRGSPAFAAATAAAAPAAAENTRRTTTGTLRGVGLPQPSVQPERDTSSVPRRRANGRTDGRTDHRPPLTAITDRSQLTDCIRHRRVRNLPVTPRNSCPRGVAFGESPPHPPELEFPALRKRGTENRDAGSGALQQEHFLPGFEKFHRKVFPTRDLVPTLKSEFASMLARVQNEVLLRKRLKTVSVTRRIPAMRN